MITRIALALAIAAASSSAWATPVQYGLGAAFRYGSFAGFTSNGASVDLRLGQIALQGMAFEGERDIEGELGDSFFGLFDLNENYDIDKAVIKQKGAAAQIKLHPMNGSFYFGFGGGRTVGTAKLEAKATSGETLDEELVVTRDLTTLSIGNVWTPGHVMIGCEWGAIAGASNVKKEWTSESNAGSNADLQDLKDDFDETVTAHSGKSNVHLLLVYLGIMVGA